MTTYPRKAGIYKFTCSVNGKVMSQDTKEKISKSMSGRVFSQEHKENVRKSKLGKPRSEETKEKIRQTLAKNKSRKENL